MFRTQIEKFLVGENIATSVIREKGNGSAHYVLLRISLFGKDSFAICVLDNEYALESVGDDAKYAMSLFELIVKEAALPSQLFDIITDQRREKELEEL